MITKKEFILSLMLGLAAVSPSLAADNGCEDEENDAVVAELALCSTHAYNVGFTENPTTADQKQLMNDVIAMKTTVITQQLYKQYEQLDSMLARFKTQLEKAVLTDTLAAAGAKKDDDDSGGGSYRSNDKYIVLNGAENCLKTWSSGQEAALECLGRNVSLVISTVNNGSLSDARKQLKQDIQAMESILGNDKFVCKGKESDTCDGNCNKFMSGADTKKDAVLQCSYTLVAKINQAKEANKKGNQQQPYMWAPVPMGQ